MKVEMTYKQAIQMYLGLKGIKDINMKIDVASSTALAMNKAKLEPIVEGFEIANKFHDIEEYNKKQECVLRETSDPKERNEKLAKLNIEYREVLSRLEEHKVDVDKRAREEKIELDFTPVKKDFVKHSEDPKLVDLIAVIVPILEG